MIKGPCQGCPDRQPHCHSKCRKYIEYLAKQKEERERVQKERTAEVVIYQRESAADKVAKAHRKGHMRKG